MSILRLSISQLLATWGAYRLTPSLGQDAAIGCSPLALPWNIMRVKFSTFGNALAYLDQFAASTTNMESIRSVLSSADQTISCEDDATTLMRLAGDLMSDGRVWLMAEPILLPNDNEITDLGIHISDQINQELGTSDSKIDFNQISKWEGGQYLRGYVPASGAVTNSDSGITIASGLDLGQTNTEHMVNILMQAGLSQCYFDGGSALPQSGILPPKIDVLERCTPYVGKPFPGCHASQITAKIAKAGPVPWLTKSEADSIDKANFTYWAKYLQDHWNATPSFFSLSGNRKTALLSIRFRCGALGGNDGKYAYRNKFLKDAQAGKWKDAANDYRSWPVYYPKYNRCKEEALMLENG